jgi:hypothetical protein
VDGVIPLPVKMEGEVMKGGERSKAAK